MSEPTWELPADMFAELDQGEGWPFAGLAAAAVGTGPDQTTAKTFAAYVKTTEARVVRYIAVWDMAAKDGHCKPSSVLTPADALNLQLPDVPFAKSQGGYYTATNGVGGGERFNVGTVSAKIVPDSKLAKAIGASAPAVTNILESASDTVIAAIVADMTDETFEKIQDAFVAATTTPAVVPMSTAKQATVAKAAAKVHEHHVQQVVAKAAAAHPKNPAVEELGQGAIDSLDNAIASQTLYLLEYVTQTLDKVSKAVLDHHGPLSASDRKYIDSKVSEIEIQAASLRSATGTGGAEDPFTKLLNG